MRSIFQAQRALKERAKLLPDKALRLTGGERTEEVPVAALRPGDLLLTRPGASIPADGVLKSGRSAVNESMITGESQPVAKETGATVIAGAANREGSLRVEVTRTGKGTALAGIMRLVGEAQASRSRAQALADRAVFVLTNVAIVTIVAGPLTAVGWLAFGATLDLTIPRVVTVLVIACPMPAAAPFPGPEKWLTAARP
jgi:P-type Cu2+ transporter